MPTVSHETLADYFGDVEDVDTHGCTDCEQGRGEHCTVCPFNGADRTPTEEYGHGTSSLPVDYEGIVNAHQHAIFCGDDLETPDSFVCDACGRMCLGTPAYVLGDRENSFPVCLECFHQIPSAWEAGQNMHLHGLARRQAIARAESARRDQHDDDIDRIFCHRTCDVCGEDTTVGSSNVVNTAWGDDIVVCSECLHGHATAWVHRIVDERGAMEDALYRMHERSRRVSARGDDNNAIVDHQVCSVCGQLVRTVDGGWYQLSRHDNPVFMCDACRAMYGSCDACSDLIPEYQLARSGENRLCPRCVDRYFLCSECGCTKSRAGYAGEDENLCRGCYPKVMERTLAAYYQACAGALASEEMAYTDEPEWICTCCGEVYLVEDDEQFYTQDGLVCEDCYEENYISCDRCGDVCLSDDSVCVHVGGHDEVWCDDCAGDHSFSCEDCGERFDDDQMVQDESSTTICEGCYEDHWTRCARCECLVDYDHVYHNDDSDDDYCENCYEEPEPRHPHWLRGYEHTAATYFYDGGDDDPDVDRTQPTQRRSGDPHQRITHARGKTLYLSPEIEFDCSHESDGNWDVVRRIVDAHEDRIVVTEDGSLNYGAEMKTEPMTLAAHAAFEWENILRQLVAAGWRGHDVENPGLHVHLSRAAFDDEAHVAKFVLLFHRLWDQLAKFSRRRNFGYCKRYDDIHDEDTVYDVYSKVSDQNGHDRNLCVNLRRRDTVEVRLWKGTLNPRTLRATLEMCHLLFRVSRDTNVTDIQALTWAQVREKAGEYPNLPAYLERRGL